MAIRPADQIIHKAAWLYYTHGLRQDQVAQQLNISRASVAMYLRKARETGIVNISTSTQLFTDDVLAREIEDAFGLDAVWIAPHGRSASIRPPKCRCWRRACSSNWSRRATGSASPGAAPSTPSPTSWPMPTCRMSPSSSSAAISARPIAYRPDQCTMEIARRLNAEGLNFYAPLVLSTEELAGAACAPSRSSASSLPASSDCDLALYSVGTRRRRQPRRQVRRADGCRDGTRCAAQGAAGVIAGQIIDAEGALLDCSYNRRCISADLASLRAIPQAPGRRAGTEQVRAAACRRSPAASAPISSSPPTWRAPARPCSGRIDRRKPPGVVIGLSPSPSNANIITGKRS